MELNSVIFGSIVVFGISIILLYTANMNQEKRYKQISLPIIALMMGVVLISLDATMTHVYQQLFSNNKETLIPYIPLVLNLTFIMGFLLIKWGWKIGHHLTSMFDRSYSKKTRKRVGKRIGKLSQVFEPLWKRKGSDEGTVSLVYMKHRGKKVLKKEWTYLSTFFKVISILPLAFLILLIIGNVHQLSLIQYLPKYPVVSLILLLEIAWFLNGQRFPYSEGAIDGKDAITRRLASYEDLFNQYKELWQERLVADGIVKENDSHHRRNHFTYENVSSNHENQVIVNAICERLKKKNMIIEESYTRILSEIIQENDVMIEDVIYDEFSSYFFPALYHLLTKNKKILVIAPNEGTVKEAVVWFKKELTNVSGISNVWQVSTFQDALEQNKNPDVLIVSPSTLQEKRFLQYLSQLEKTSILECMILLHAEKLIPSSSTILHCFNLNLKVMISKKPQYIILTEWYEGLEHSVRSVLQCEPIDINAASNASRNLYYMVWKQEGEKWFQHTILPNLSHRQLEAEVVLALPAIKANIEPVHFVCQKNTNIRESIQEVFDVKNSLLEIGFDLDRLDQFSKMVQLFDENLQVPIDEFSFLLVRDHHHNIVDALNLWKGTGRTATFVHIVSPPYLLRDYLANQLDFYNSTNRTIAPLAPRLSQSIWSLAYFLLDRLCQFSIQEEEVKSYLSRAKISSYRSVPEGIHMLFTKAFGSQLDYRFNIESTESVSFDRSKKDFIETTQYHIPYSTREKILPRGFRFLKIQHNNNTIAECMEGHFFQQYLPGQYHSFNGELYKIQKVDLEYGVVDVTFEPLFEKKYYRQLSEYRVSKVENELHMDNKTVTFERFNLSMSSKQVQIHLHTSGYLELNEWVNLASMKVHSFSKEEEIQRDYKNGHLLCIDINSREGHLEKADQIEFTLSLLLNELFLSLFPDTHAFVKACTTVDETFFDQNDFLSKKLQLLIPTIQFDRQPVQQGQISLYILEDTPYHVGIIETIRDNWEKIFDLLHDYLYWLLHESNGTSDYLYFGYGQYPKELALFETFSLLNELLTRKKLQEVRTDYLARKGEGGIVRLSGTEIQCVFCGRMVTGVQFHELDDGRQRCFTCHQSAIDTVSQMEPLYQQIRQNFKEIYDETLPTDIALTMLSTAEIHQMSGLPFIPKAGNPRITGKASIDRNGNLSILVENGSPRIQTLSTLAHELTHIWQYENLDVNDLTLEEIEGFASWVEVHLMMEIGEASYANMLKQQLLNRNDEYGRGYRLIVEKLANLHDTATPFELFVSEKYVVKYQ